VRVVRALAFPQAAPQAALGRTVARAEWCAPGWRSCAVSVFAGARQERLAETANSFVALTAPFLEPAWPALRP